MGSWIYHIWSSVESWTFVFRFDCCFGLPCFYILYKQISQHIPFKMPSTNTSPSHISASQVGLHHPPRRCTAISTAMVCPCHRRADPWERDMSRNSGGLAVNNTDFMGISWIYGDFMGFIGTCGDFMGLIIENLR